MTSRHLPYKSLQDFEMELGKPVVCKKEDKKNSNTVDVSNINSICETFLIVSDKIIFFVEFIPLWYIILKICKLTPLTTTNFISCVNTCYMFRSLLTILRH
jgi:hypothetical protein